MKVILLFAIFLSSSVGLAEGAGVVVEVPRVVIYQLINVVLLIGILVYFLKDKISGQLKAKRETFLQAAEEVKRLKQEVEEQARQLKEKIREIEINGDSARTQAEQDARAYSAQLMNEANEQSEKMRKEAERNISAEIYRAIGELRAEIIAQAIVSSRDQIRDKIREPDQKRLNKEFVEKIQIVEDRSVER